MELGADGKWKGVLGPLLFSKMEVCVHQGLMVTGDWSGLTGVVIRVDRAMQVLCLSYHGIVV